MTPVPLVIVSDPGKDLDDEIALILARALTDLGLIRIEAVIAVLAPSASRARLARGTLDQLGLDVPVGIGSDIIATGPDRNRHEFEDVTYLADPTRLENGTELLLRLLDRAADESLVWLLIAGMTDPADLLRKHEALFLAKTSRVVIMGGVQQANDEVFLDDCGHMLPDTAQNNMFDREAAGFLLRRLQELRIPMTVLTRETARAVQVPRSFYDDMAGTRHPVGICLRNRCRMLVEALWRRANCAADDSRREQLPIRCDRSWFYDTFCGGDGVGRSAEDEIWDLVRGFNLYDPLACLASIESLRERFFAPEIVTIRGIEHQIIGVSKNKTGVSDRGALLTFLTQSILAGLK